jgi:hypothetical protein
VIVGITPEESSLVHVLVGVGVVVLEVTEADAEVSVEEDFEAVDVSNIVPGTFFCKDCHFSHVGVAKDFLQFTLGEHAVGLFRYELSAHGKSN